MKKYEPTNPLTKSLSKEFFHIYGREPFNLKELYNGLGFLPSKIREVEEIRLSQDGIVGYQMELVVEANMRYWGEPFYW